MKDLRTFLEQYQKDEPSNILAINRAVSSNQEVTAAVKHLEADGRLPVLVFNNIVHPDGHRTIGPLVMNLMASRHRCAYAMQTTFEQVGIDYARRTKSEKRPPVIVSRSDAPVKAIVRRGSEVDLYDFPAMNHFRMDPGPYISGGFLTTFEPETGIDNVSLQRGWVFEKNVLRCYLTAFSHNMLNFHKYEEEGRDMPVAYWIGHHPLVYLAGQAKLGYPGSHYEAIGGLLGEPLRLVASETLGENFLIPADAEVVIEGYMKAGIRVPEGPFGEYTGYTGPQIPNLLFEVTAVTHREQPHWMNILVGGADNHWGSYAIEATVYETVKAKVPSLTRVFLPGSGQSRFHAYLQFKNPKPGDAREAMMLALACDSRLKHVFAFDDDINIYDEAECLFALATRTQWDRDVMVFPRTRGMGLDPSADGNLTTKAAVDCTVPVGEAYAERNLVDADVLKGFNLTDLISSDAVARLGREVW